MKTNPIEVPKTKVETEPKERLGQGLGVWAEKLLESGMISKKDYDKFVLANDSKETTINGKVLPHPESYGFFNSIDEIKEKLSHLQNTSFIARCISKKDGTLQRIRNVSLDEACKFVDKLPGGFDDWAVEIKEFVETKMAGTIIVSPSGRTIIETWNGPHYLNTTNVPKCHAEFDPEKFHRSFQWTSQEGVTDIPELQEYAMKALRYIFPNLKPQPNKPTYVEYGFRPNGEIFFIEVSESPLLTGK